MKAAWDEGLEELKRTTPARIGAGRAGTRPTTEEWLKLRRDHAAAVDAVYGEVPEEKLREWGLFTVSTSSPDKSTYLKRPDLGRSFPPEGETLLRERCKVKPVVQVVVSDGLSASAVAANAGDTLMALQDSLLLQGIPAGTPFFVRGGRVGIMNAIGDLLEPEAVVLLIGERPGLVTAESLSAYMGYRPCTGKSDADRMVVSNIHRSGMPPAEAGAHIGTLVARILERKASGVAFEG